MNILPLVFTSRQWSDAVLESELEKIQFNELLQFHTELFNKEREIEIFFNGNLNRVDIISFKEMINVFNFSRKESKSTYNAIEFPGML